MAIPPTTLHPILPILPWPSRWRKITRNFHKLPRPIRSSESLAPGCPSRLPQSWNPRNRNNGFIKHPVQSPATLHSLHPAANRRHASKVTNDSTGEWVYWRYCNVRELLWYSKWNRHGIMSCQWDHVMSFIDDNSPLRNHFLMLSRVKFAAKPAALN